MSEAVATSPPQLTDEELEQQLRVQLVDVSHGVTANAVAGAENYINEQTTQRGVKGFLKKIWHGNIVRDYIRQREIQNNREEIVESQNLYVLDDASQAEHDQATASIVDRFTSEYDLLHQGETNQAFEDVEQGEQLMQAIRQLVAEYARGDIGYDAVIEERTRILAQFGRSVRENSNDRNRGLLYADNILEVAHNARLAIEHGFALERIDEALSGKIGEATVGVRTEFRQELTDKLVDNIYKSRVGSLVNETTLFAGATAAITIAKLTTKKLAIAAGATLTLGVGAGAVAGIREHYRVGQERTHHMREMAEGGQIEADSNRREQLEATRYETVSAQSLIDNLASATEAASSGETADIQALIASIAEAQARIDYSDQNGIDLIHYSAKTAVEGERLALDIELARARVTVSQAMSNSGETFDIESVALESAELLEQDINDRDRVFRKLRRNRSLKAGGTALVVGGTIGLAIQELHSVEASELRGVFENPDDDNDRRSLLSGIFDGDSAEKTEIEGAGHREFYDDKIGEHLKAVAVELPEGYTLENTRPGEQFGWDIMGPDGEPVINKGLEWDTQGNLSKETRALLREEGFNLKQETLDYKQRETVSSEIMRSPEQYINAHPEQFEGVHRELWFDNDTPGVYDQNELKLWWGGPTGSGIDSNGDYVFNVMNMGSDGSYHHELSTDAQQLVKDGKMQIALSMTRESQGEVFMVPIDSNGNAVIEADSYIGKSLFENQDGKANFTGAYAEAVQLMGENAEGKEDIRMLATVVGENDPNNSTDIVHHSEVKENTHFITKLEAPAEGEIPIEVAPVLPVYARRGLESLSPGESGGYGYYGGYVEGGGEPGSRRGKVPFAKEVEMNPDAEIDANKSTTRYLDSLRPKYKESIDSLSKDIKKQPKVEKPKVVVMIPAAAHQEGKNIYRTLEQYKAQVDVSEEDFEIVVFANNPIGTTQDITLSEIQRFQEENPSIKVRLIEKELAKEEANIGWVRKAVTDTVIADLRDRGIDLNEVLLVSNDADSQWIDPRYIKTIIEKAEAQPEVDGFLGFIDWGHDAYKAHPETLAATRLMQMLEIYLRRSKNQIGSSGANFVFRPGAYTAVGGYRTNTSLGEDVELGRMIKGMRSGAQTRRPIAFLGRSSEVNTSARRALDKLFKDGGAPVTQWSDEFSAYDELRTKDFDLKDFDFNDPDEVARLVENSERMLNQTLRVYRRSLSDETVDSYKYGRLDVLNHETMRQINRMLSVIGVKVRWSPDGSFKVVDGRRMIANLQRWQSAHSGSTSISRPAIKRS